MGTYGFRITGLDALAAELSEVPASWPQLHVEFTRSKGSTSEGPAGTIQVGSDRAEISLRDGERIEIQRDPLIVSFVTREPVPAPAILHPFLGLPAAIASRWLDRFSLHGGAFAYAGRAWGLIGDRGAGKSSTLGYLVGQGVPVLSDDILITSGTSVFSGPRSVDLRADAAHLGGEPLGLVGNRQRWRLRPSACEPALPLGGFIRLRWGDEVVLTPLGPRARLDALLESSVIRPDVGDAEQLLALAALPAWEYARPSAVRDLAQISAKLMAALPCSG